MTVSETKVVNGSTWSQAVATATPALKHTFNTTQNWTVPNNISAAFFMIAGGGGGGGGAGPNMQSGGAGGGGVYPGWLALQPGSTISITIGAGGTAGPATPDFATGGSGGASYVTIGNFTAGANGGSGGGMSNTSGTAGGGNTFTSATGLAFSSPVISNVNFIFGKDTPATNQNGNIANHNSYAGSGSGQFDTTNYMPHCHGGSGLTGGSGAGAGNITFGNVLSVIGYSGCGYGGPAGASVVTGPSGGGGGIVGAGSAATANAAGAGGAGGGAGGAATMRSNTAGAAGGAGAVLIFY